MTQALNGAGDTRTPTVINFVCFWLFQIPLAYLLAEGFHMKSSGALAAIPIAETLIAGVTWHYFKRGKWKAIQI
jgi:Na+-driven multidrug efflux pump